MAAHAADLVRLNCDLIVTSSISGVRAVKNASNAISIVFTNVGDPVEQGWSIASRGLVATSQDYRQSYLIWAERGWSYSRSLFPTLSGWYLLEIQTLVKEAGLNRPGSGSDTGTPALTPESA